jgi:hypothetical protein
VLLGPLLEDWRRDVFVTEVLGRLNSTDCALLFSFLFSYNVQGAEYFVARVRFFHTRYTV